MDNEQKAKIMEDEARKIDRYGCSLNPPDGFAALLREAAAMLRGRDGVRWEGFGFPEFPGSVVALYRGRFMAVEFVFGDICMWAVSHQGNEAVYAVSGSAPTLDAAKAAAVKWVDGQEGR
jgi:hypothetical protein